MTTTISPATTATTITAPAPISRPAVWTHVSEGLWVGAREGEFVGTVEFIDGGFTASDHRGVALARIHSLAAAKVLAEAGSADDEEQVLRWHDDRRTLALGWAAFASCAVASVVIASQFFV